DDELAFGLALAEEVGARETLVANEVERRKILGLGEDDGMNPWQGPGEQCGHHLGVFAPHCVQAAVSPDLRADRDAGEVLQLLQQRDRRHRWSRFGFDRTGFRRGFRPLGCGLRYYALRYA